MLGGSRRHQAAPGGQIGANITLRDTTLPTDQAELDEFSRTWRAASRPRADAVHRSDRQRAGRARRRRCRPAMSASPAPSRSTRRCRPIRRWCATARRRSPAALRRLHRHHQRGAEQHAWATIRRSAPNTSGLGPTGTLSAPYAAPPTLGRLRSTMLAAQAQDSASTTSQLSHRAGGADHAQRQAVDAERRQHGYRDVEHDRSCRTPMAPTPR